MRTYEKIYTYLKYTLWILYIIVWLGVSELAPTYLDELHFYFNLFLAIGLIILFNPLKRLTYGDLDRKIAFSAGIALLTSVGLETYKTHISHLTKIFS